jgi:MFS family permease
MSSAFREGEITLRDTHDPSQGVVQENAQEVAPAVPRYAWVVLAAAALVSLLQGGLHYGFAVFFKPLSESFGWSREATSGVFSVYAIVQGLAAMVLGGASDRFGYRKVILPAAFLVGLGFVLNSRISALWHLYLTYGLLIGISFSAFFPIANSALVRWFTRHQGLALGILMSGGGAGTAIFLPIIERLIFNYGWRTSFLLLGVSTWLILIPCSLLIRYPKETPAQEPQKEHDQSLEDKRKRGNKPDDSSSIVKAAFSSPSLWMLIGVFALISFPNQMVMVHLINYATDIGITAFVAATFVSAIGVAKVVGPLVLGGLSDRLGPTKVLILSVLGMMAGLIWLLFAREVWMFYLFAIGYGFFFGGLGPMIGALIHRFFGPRAVATLVGVLVFSLLVGGSLGVWAGGRIFDLTGSYQVAFGLGILMCFVALGLSLGLSRQARRRVMPVPGNR